MRPERLFRWLFKPLLFVACLLPFALLVRGTLLDDLGPNPLETVTHVTGDWALRFLLITLAMTPLRRLLGQAWPLRLRRMLGLYAFFYATLHLLIWTVLDQELRWTAMWEDITRRPYVTVGFTAWLLLVPLALTSTRAAMRRLGRRWARLHRLVYPTAALGVLHYWWLVKADWLQPGLHGLILALLILSRLQLRGRFVRQLSGESPG